MHSSLLLSSLLGQVLILVPFFLVGLLQQKTIASLSASGLDKLLIESIPGCFVRYYWLLGAASLVALLRIYFDFKILPLYHSRAEAVFFSTSMLFLLAWVALTRSLQFPICGDDAYIDFRYVHNWVSGVGFDYNPGELVLGFTSHVHVLILSALSLLFGISQIDILSQALNIILQFFVCSLVYLAFADILRSRLFGLVGAAVYAFQPYNLNESIFGKETFLVQLLIILTIWLMHHGRYQSTAWLSCLMPFVRPEGVIWSFVILVSTCLRRSGSLAARLKIWYLPGFLALVYLGTIFWIFKTVLPHGMIAKDLMIDRDPYWFVNIALKTIGSGGLLPLVDWISINDKVYVGAGIVASILFLILVRNPAFRVYKYFVLLFFWIVSLENPMPFSWYMSWFSFVNVMLFTVIFQLLSGKKTLMRLPGLIGSLLCLLILVSQTLSIPRRLSSDLTAVTFKWDDEYKRLLSFSKAVDIIKERFSGSANTTIAAPEIGYIGYKHPGKIIDLCGLVSPKVVAYGRPLGKPDVIYDLQPDYVISVDVFLWDLFHDELFLASYKRVCSFDTVFAKGKKIHLYRRIYGWKKTD